MLNIDKLPPALAYRLLSPQADIITTDLESGDVTILIGDVEDCKTYTIKGVASVGVRSVYALPKF